MATSTLRPGFPRGHEPSLSGPNLAGTSSFATAGPLLPPGSQPRDAGITQRPAGGVEAACRQCYQLFGERPIFLGRIDELRALLGLADPSPSAGAEESSDNDFVRPEDARLDGRVSATSSTNSGAQQGLAVHKCGPFFVLDSGPYPCALGAPVARSPGACSTALRAMPPADSVEAVVTPREEEQITPEPRSTPAHGCGSEASGALEQEWPVVPFISVEEILFGDRRSSKSSTSSHDRDSVAPATDVVQTNGTSEVVGRDAQDFAVEGPSATGRHGGPIFANRLIPHAADSPEPLPHVLRQTAPEPMPVPRQAAAALSPVCPGWEQVTVKNTFLHVEEEESEPDVGLPRTRSAPAALGRHADEQPPALPLGRSPASSWAIIPWREAQRLPVELRKLMRLTDSPPSTPPSTPPDVPVVPATLAPSLLRPRPSVNCAVHWSLGEFSLLAGCDVRRFRGPQGAPVSGDGASLCWTLGSLPATSGHLDAWLAEMLQGTLEKEGGRLLPLPRAKCDGSFDPDPLIQQGEQLLRFLWDNCQREGGTYWLSRETTGAEEARCVEYRLHDLTPPDASELSPRVGALPLCLKRQVEQPALAAPLAQLCFRLAGGCHAEDRCRLLQKGLSLLEPSRTLPEHRLAYATAALSFAVVRMAERPDSEAERALDGTLAAEGDAQQGPPCRMSQSSVALWYLEECIRLLTPICRQPFSSDCPTAETSRSANDCEVVADAHNDVIADMGECDERYPSLACADYDSAAEEDRTGIAQLLAQVYLYYTTVLIKIAREVSRVSKRLLGASLAVKREVAVCVVVQLAWLSRAHLAVQRAFACLRQGVEGLEPDPLTLLDREILDMVGDCFATLSMLEVNQVPWPPPTAFEEFASFVRSVASVGANRRDLGSSLLGQLSALHRGVWDEELAQHPHLSHVCFGTEAALQAWEIFAQATAARCGGPEDSENNKQRATVLAKRARIGRSLAADAWLRNKPAEADAYLQHAFALAAESGDIDLQVDILSDAAEIRAGHAETLTREVRIGTADPIFAFGIEQYAEYCRALELCRTARNKAGAVCKSNVQRLAMIELKLGVHLLHYSDVQECLVDGPQDVALSADADAYSAAFAGVGTSSSAWAGRARSRNLLDLSLEHLQRALHLFEGNGEETAAVHYQLAEAYVRQVKDMASMSGTAPESINARAAAGHRHAERAAARFEASQLWRDAAAAYRKLAELRTSVPATGRFVEGLCDAFSELVTVESRWLEQQAAADEERGVPSEAASNADTIAGALVELRGGIGDLLRAALRHSAPVGAVAGGAVQQAASPEDAKGIRRVAKKPKNGGGASARKQGQDKDLAPAADATRVPTVLRDLYRDLLRGARLPADALRRAICAAQCPT